MGDPRLFMDSAKVRVYICRFVQYAGHYHIGHHVGIKPFWWLNPWSWPIRVMCPTIGIHPNGVPLENGDPLTSWAVVPPAVVLSVLLFAILARLTRRSFSPAVDRKSIKREAV